MEGVGTTLTWERLQVQFLYNMKNIFGCGGGGVVKIFH